MSTCAELHAWIMAQLHFRWHDLKEDWLQEVCIQFHCSANGIPANSSPSPGWIRVLIQFRYISLSQYDVWDGEGLRKRLCF